MPAPVHPSVHGIRPLLHHMPALYLVFRLVVDAARRAPILVRQALLDPIPIEAKFEQQKRPKPPQVVDCEWLERQTILLGLLNDRIGDPIERRSRHWSISVVARRQKIPRVASAGLARNHDVES